MITSAFLLKVVIYGLVASLVIPVIDFLIFVIRESRKSPDVAAERSTLNEWHPSVPSRRKLAPQLRKVESETDQAVEKQESDAVAPISGRFVKQNGTVAYMVSNGVTITPGFRPTPRPNHPHSEYWQYGNMAFYERR